MSLLPDRCCMCGGNIKDYHTTCHWKFSNEQRESKRDANDDYLTKCREFSKWYVVNYER
tara:strand:+ start:3794 stop:3970 length:177 start_codon:yes stop_codon:yes gene_type:complete